jgi:hypothetical protein
VNHFRQPAPALYVYATARTVPVAWYEPLIVYARPGVTAKSQLHSGGGAASTDAFAGAGRPSTATAVVAAASL